jgi:isopentenyl phosphate kinase
MLVFIKLGGSLITDKRVESSFREGVTRRLAEEIYDVLNVNPDLRFLVGHGSGSFGHFAAARHNTANGVQSSEEWRAFAHVSNVAAELNHLVVKAFEQVGLPVWRIQPSASALSHDTNLVDLSLSPIRIALDKGLIPLVYGDVAIDEMKGGTIISTEKLFFYLARHLPVSTVLLLGEVEGVLGADGALIPEINLHNYPALKAAFGGSAGIDVTGGMETKVSDMLSLTEFLPHLSIRILDGRQPGLLKKTLLSEAAPGTLIRRGTP